MRIISLNNPWQKGRGVVGICSATFLPARILCSTPHRMCRSVVGNGEEEIDGRTTISAKELPTQGDAMVAGVDPIDYINQQLQDILRPPNTEDYLAVRNR